MFSVYSTPIADARKTRVCASLKCSKRLTRWVLLINWATSSQNNMSKLFWMATSLRNTISPQIPLDWRACPKRMILMPFKVVSISRAWTLSVDRPQLTWLQPPVKQKGILNFTRGIFIYPTETFVPLCSSLYRQHLKCTNLDNLKTIRHDLERTRLVKCIRGLKYETILRAKR